MNTPLSYFCGSSDEPLLGETMGEFLDRVVRLHGDRPALISPDPSQRWSFDEFRAAVDRAAKGLLALGLKKADRIGIWSANRSEWVLLQFAAARIGLILVTINPAYRLLEAEHALKQSGCRAVVAQAAHKSSNYRAMLIELTRGAGGNLLPDLEFVVMLDAVDEPGWFSWSRLNTLADSVDDEVLLAACQATQFDDPINIQFTSGTTGAPKGVTLSHHNLLNNGRHVGRTLRLSHEDSLCLCVPLYHCFGLVMGVIGAFSQGASLVLAGEGFEPARVLDVVEAHRCSVLYGVPTMFVALLEEQGRRQRDVGRLRTGIMAGATCPVEVMRKVIDEMGIAEITICYGMTETSPVSFQSQVDDSLERRVQTVGRVHPNLEVKIVDELGRITPCGTPGELLVRGYSVMLGYWNQEDKTREVVDAARWMHTGDIAVLDEHGYCQIVGRIKDMLIRGGENIYPREVEEALFRHPDIAEAQVFGVPDARFGEEVCAWIRKRPGSALDADVLRAWCRERIAHYKVPRYVQFVEEFPLTVTGKVQKHVMRERMVERLAAATTEVA